MPAKHSTTGHRDREVGGTKFSNGAGALFTLHEHAAFLNA
jgi:hypothetical protein